jgi:DNA-binding winged helix-turn-helix (wHTH) protein
MTSYELGDSFGRRFWRWLDRFGFVDDPFALQEADKEREFLPHFFVDRPYLHDVLGNPARPQATVLMAGRGAGKTATREMVVYECSHANPRRRALAVRYDDFSSLLAQVDGRVASITAGHHVQQILRAAAKALAYDVPALHFESLDGDSRQLLMSFVDGFADPVSKLRLAPLLKAEAVAISWGHLSPRESMETFARLITKLGQTSQVRYQSLYVLVDRVEETPLGAPGAVRILQPLVADGPLLEASGVAFKFFLPIEVGQRLHEEASLRPDRVGIHQITWDEQALRDMINQRLVYYSGGSVRSLGDLCRSGARGNELDRLISVCDRSPRTLLRLCRSLLHHHVRPVDETSPLISNAELVDTIREFQQQRQAEQPLANVAPDGAGAEGRPTTGLYLDSSGHVWVDGDPVETTLSPLEYALLKTLWQHEGKIVSKEALIEAVWPTTLWTSEEKVEQDATEQNLRKLITRLRERLPGDPERFIKNVRARGYWLKASGDGPAGASGEDS